MADEVAWRYLELMFHHDAIELHSVENVPLDRDIYLMDVKWMAEYERGLLDGLAGAEWPNVGYISYAAARSAHSDGVELSWYPNIHDRFHEIRIHLPRRHFVACVEVHGYDEREHVFVTSEWLDDIHLRTNSVFAMVDAIGVRRALTEGTLLPAQVLDLRRRIDAIAAAHPDIAFVSLADSVIMKSNWSIGAWDSEVSYTYDPEKIVRVLPDVVEAYREALGLKAYAVIAQGRNGLYPGELTHISASGNHLSLNSLGLPFAQLQAIESAVRVAAKSGLHGFADIYMDDHFFHSLKWKQEFDKNARAEFPYAAPLAGCPCAYGLFLVARDSFTSTGRVAVQALSFMGCAVGICIPVQGGQQLAHVALVDLQTGQIVWFNQMTSSVGDIREADGAMRAAVSLRAADVSSAYFRNCAAARLAGAAPVRVGEAGYGRHLDRDGDGVGCE